MFFRTSLFVFKVKLNVFLDDSMESGCKTILVLIRTFTLCKDIKNILMEKRDVSIFTLSFNHAAFNDITCLKAGLHQIFD